MVVDKKYYDILELNPSCSQSDIKTAYRSLAKKWHPDKNKSPEAETKFKEILSAYEILSDEEKRSIYDNYGPSGNPNTNTGFQMPTHMFDMFQNQKPREKNEYQKIYITLEDAYNGCNIDLDITRKIKCVDCNGSGVRTGVSLPKCNICNGSGRQVKLNQIAPGLVQQFVTPCSKCNGSGIIITPDIQCKKCNGSKCLISNDKINVCLNRGTLENTQIKYPNLASYNPDHPEVTDLIYIIEYKPHPIFLTNKINNIISLFMIKQISLAEAITGNSFTLKHLNGKDVTIRTPRGYIIKPNELLGIKELGFPDVKRNTFNSLYVKFEVLFPISYSLSDEKLNTIRDVFELKEIENSDKDIYISIFNIDTGNEQETPSQCNQQ